MSEGKLLSGLRILDLTTVVVGPAATLRLADYGAEVIKIEPPEGDLMRRLGGPSNSGSLSGKFLHFNRAKRFACIDIKKRRGRDAVEKILDRCDVLVSNMRPEALARLGLDADTVRARHPRLVHCLITGFGPDGPYRGLPAYDSVIQGASGIAGLTIKRDGVPRLQPLLAVDHVVAEIVAGAVSAALVRRSRTGSGASIEVPMLETMAAFVLQEHLGPASFHPPLGSAGDMRILDPNNQPAATADGWITVTANTDAQAHGLLKAIGRTDLIGDPRFRTVADRFRNAGAWYSLRAEALRANTTEHWLTALREADVPAMPCHSIDALTSDPHLAAVDLVTVHDHPIEGRVSAIRPTVFIDGGTYQPGPPAMALGWDTREILLEAGYSHDEVDDLVETLVAFERTGEAEGPPAASPLQRDGAA